MKVIDLIYDVKNNDLINRCHEVSICDIQNYYMVIAGSVVTKSGRNDYGEIASLFEEYGKDITLHLRGMYILVIFRKNAQEVFVFQNRSTSPLPFYFAKTNSNVYMSTSLSTILRESKLPRKYNDDAVQQFLVNGFVGGNDTLIENVSKLDKRQYLQIKGERVGLSEAEYDWKVGTNDLSEEEAWAKILNSSISDAVKGKKEVCIPLSGGYDSNYLLSEAAKNDDLLIHAVSVGGKRGRNETESAEAIAKHYPNVIFHSCLTSNHTLNNFPDIVKRLDGSCFELGVFLQYELNKVINELGIHYSICGECADEVMNQNYHDSFIKNYDHSYYHSYVSYVDNPYEIASQIVLRKSGVLSNSFEIESLYPYLEDNFVNLCNTLRRKNGTSKEFHKAFCRSVMQQEVVDLIKKSSGSTDAISLFESEKEIKLFCREIENSAIYRSHKELIDGLAGNNKKGNRIRNMLSLAHGLVQRITGRGYLERKAIEQSHLEKKLRVYLNCKYLILFSDAE